MTLPIVVLHQSKRALISLENHLALRSKASKYMISIAIKNRETTQDLSVLLIPDSDSQTHTNTDGTTMVSSEKQKNLNVTILFEKNK